MLIILLISLQKKDLHGTGAVWGTNVKSGGVSKDEPGHYAKWLAERYKNKPNIIWLNGGDIKGSDSMNIWKTIGKYLQEK